MNIHYFITLATIKTTTTQYKEKDAILEYKKSNNFAIKHSKMLKKNLEIIYLFN